MRRFEKPAVFRNAYPKIRLFAEDIDPGNSLGAASLFHSILADILPGARS